MLIEDTSLERLERKLEIMREENDALRAALCGLYVGLSHISDIHGAIVGQALGFAQQIGSAERRKGSDRPAINHAKLLEDIRGAVIDYRPIKF